MTSTDSIRNGREKSRLDVALVGDTNLDLLMYGLPEELPCERELLARDMAIRVGGSGAITAHNLAALGNHVGFITTAPGDQFGNLCHEELRQAGVDLSHCISVPDARTGVTVHLQHKEQRHMFTYAGATFQLTFDHLDLDYLANSRHFHMSSYYLQRALTPHVPELFAKLKSAGVTISLDPNDDPAQTWDRCILDSLQYVDVLMPNEREASLIADKSSLDQAITALRRQVPLLVIKRGSKGASAYAKDQDWHQPAQKADVVDAVGAGDSFNAGFLHGWLRRWPIEQALAFGNRAGALSTTKSGGTAAFCDRNSIEMLKCALNH